MFDQAVSELSERYRVPYILKDLEKLSEHQVSQIMGISIPAVKNRVHRARLAIREKVAHYLGKS